MALEAGYAGCPMADSGYGYVGAMGYGGFPWVWLLSLLLVGGIAVLITYLIMNNGKSKPKRHKHKAVKR